MHIFIVLFIALLAVLPELILGTNRLDAGWNFSYAVNAMEAPFNHFTQNNSPYLYPYFQIPFAALSIKYGSVLFHFFIIIGLASITYYKTKSNPKYALLVTLGVLTSYELLCFRSEHFSIFFTLLLYFFIFENHNTRVKIILIPSLIAAIHPLHAFMTLLALLGTEKKYTKHPFLILITFLICSVLLFLAHIFFPENIYTTKLIGFIIHNDFTALFKFIKYNALSIILFFWVINKKWTADLLVSVFAIVLACSIIGVSQYFALLFIPLILTSISHGQKLQNNALSYILILSSIFFNQIHPLFVLFEKK